MLRLLLAACLLVPAVAAQPTAYVGGRWAVFDDGGGVRFVARDTTWADGGVFVAEPPGGLPRLVELGEAFVVPPFGDGHLHAFYDPASLAAQDSLLVARGVLTALNPLVPRTERASVRGLSPTVEVAYAVAGVTVPGSHGATAYEARALGLQAWDVWGPRGDEIRASRLREGDAYHFAPTLAALDAVWPRVLASGTEVVKTLLDHSEALGTDDAEPSLSPEVLAEVVRRAHADGLRVVAHVETAADLAAALDAGVDALAHVPGYAVSDRDPRRDPASPYVMSDALVARLAASGVPVTPTLARGPLTLRYVPAASRPDSSAQASVRAFHRDLLRRLQAAGVALAVGADSGGLWAWDDVAYAVEIGGLTPAEALRAWAVTTPRMVFPDRPLGALAPGFEASLLALACDPTVDWACTEHIVYRERGGTPLDAGLPDAEVAARWHALDVPTFAAAPTPADGPLARGLKALADGDARTADLHLLRARATVADSLRPFVDERLARAAEARFDWAAAVRYRAQAGDGDATTSTEAGFARFPAARLTMAVPETTVPLDAVAVPATVNGAPVRAIVDSGSPGSGVSRALVERLGLRVDTTARGVSVVPSMGLRFDTYAVLLDSVHVGDATLYNVPATVGWGDAEPDAGADEEIFLGSNVLRHLVGAVRYDYADSTFTIVRDALPEAPPQFLVEPGTGAPALPVRVAGHDAVAVVDTGNLASVYLARGAFDLPGEPERVLSGDRADGGTWRVALHRLPFQIPGHPDGEHLAYEADYIFSADDPVTVLLGAPVWAGGTLTIDYANRRVGWERAE